MFFEDFHSFIIGQILGMYLVITSIIMLARTRYYKEMINNIRPNSGSVVFASSFGLLLGLFLITIHNHWVWEPDIIVTVIAWFIVIKSVLWLAFPEAMLKFVKNTYRGAGYFVVIIIAFILGLLLLTRGYYPFI